MNFSAGLILRCSSVTGHNIVPRKRQSPAKPFQGIFFSTYFDRTEPRGARFSVAAIMLTFSGPIHLAADQGSSRQTSDIKGVQIMT
jgi:hypothetical protein